MSCFATATLKTMFHSNVAYWMQAGPVKMKGASRRVRAAIPCQTCQIKQLSWSAGNLPTWQLAHGNSPKENHQRQQIFFANI